MPDVDAKVRPHAQQVLWLSLLGTMGTGRATILWTYQGMLSVCLVVLPWFNLMPRKDTASWRTFPVGEVLTGVQFEPSLITGKRYLLVNIDTESFEYAIDWIHAILRTVSEHIVSDWRSLWMESPWNFHDKYDCRKKHLITIVMIFLLLATYWRQTGRNHSGKSDCIV